MKPVWEWGSDARPGLDRLVKEMNDYKDSPLMESVPKEELDALRNVMSHALVLLDCKPPQRCSFNFFRAWDELNDALERYRPKGSK